MHSVQFCLENTTIFNFCCEPFWKVAIASKWTSHTVIGPNSQRFSQIHAIPEASWTRKMVHRFHFVTVLYSEDDDWCVVRDSYMFPSHIRIDYGRNSHSVRHIHESITDFRKNFNGFRRPPFETVYRNSSTELGWLMIRRAALWSGLWYSVKQTRELGAEFEKSSKNNQLSTKKTTPLLHWRK